MKKSKLDFLYPIITIIVIILLWEVITNGFRIPAYILPNPIQVVQAFINDFSLIMYHLGATLLEGVIGLGISIVLSVLMAICMDRFTFVRKTLYPILVISQTIPVMAIAPLLIIWFGFGMIPKVLLIIIMCFFPITVNLTDGFSQVDPDSMNMFRVWKASGWQTYKHLKIPFALPYFFSGLRISVTWMVMAAILAEWLGSERGIGVYMLRAKQSYALDKVFAAVVCVVIVSLLLIGIVSLIRKKVIFWAGNQ
ncbi:MAG: ABC transporter permease [Parasporobacterium sp.]|nr:ABC transporter permease [Parasporobacterium sp.]